jgi:peptidoglycan/xylan/chitin deacetylase (PgdA/CDA1 family)
MAASADRRLSLKVDCDTFQGTANGIPNLLRLFDRFGLRASFFFTLGPDNSGRAVFRVFTHKGFLKKMLRSNAVATYGVRTMLYGTLLPAPMIGKRLADTIRSVAAAGHEVGVHGWDHIRWHSRLDRLDEVQVENDVGRAHDTFQSIFGAPARSSAAPGWHAHSLA